MKGSNKDAWAFFNYAIARIIEKTQKLHAMYWFNLFLISELPWGLKQAEAIKLSWLQLPSVFP